MNLHDLPPRDQERYLDGVTVGTTRARCGAGASMPVSTAATPARTWPPCPPPRGGPQMTAVQLRRLDPGRNMARFYSLAVQQGLKPRRSTAAPGFQSESHQA
jgi:hypothetical protein